VVTSKVLEFCFIVSGSDRMAGRQRGRGGQKDSYNTATTTPEVFRRIVWLQVGRTEDCRLQATACRQDWTLSTVQAFPGAGTQTFGECSRRLRQCMYPPAHFCVQPSRLSTGMPYFLHQYYTKMSMSFIIIFARMNVRDNGRDCNHLSKFPVR